MASDMWAVFIDIMGFAEAVEGLTEAEHFELSLGIQSERPDLHRPSSPATSLVLSRYYHFHRLLHAYCAFQHEHIHSVIEFSDSAYVIFTEGYAAELLAVELMRELIKDEVPVRMGIGVGTFARMTFATYSDPRGLLTASSPFIGTSVIRAYRAQSCSAPGFRIFLHPSALPRRRFQSAPYFKRLPLAPEEADISAPAELIFMTAPAELANMTHSLGNMRNNVTNPRALRHYDATLTALRRFNGTLVVPPTQDVI